ncbi:hypothetical protein FOC1_g10007000 [Fusarium oxysporum f. sp. cubense race 1]|uniref:DUF7708 domain-containing protein n=1 Tax=Fusarium oxysporum f. sp. cubense (strain race 1) TaxID=1229664 RepID=N4UB53_FUSC1|nr:hypothetical protein FOC1_g10007000 [Fusarium oxysporum f. sp. cubense race 1]
MNRLNKVEPSKGITRRFSDDVVNSTPEQHLGRALAAKVAFDRNRERLRPSRDEWDRLLLEGRQLANVCIPDEEVVLFEQSRRLYAAWDKFRRDLPKDQQMQLEGRDRPDINYLVATVTKASATWQSDREESKLGKLKSKFHSLCETCHDHSSLLAIVPKDDKYVTLLTGSLSAIAQATINHQNIAEGVADTLDDLSHDIDFWNRQMMEHGNIPSLRQYIQELYVIVFEFFTEVFNKWSKSGWKRFLTSFDDGAFNKLFTAKKDRMLAIERRMERHVSLDFRHRTTESLEMVIQNQKELLYRLPNQLNEQRLFLGESLQQLLEQQQLFIMERPQPALVTSMIEGTAEECSDAADSDANEPPFPELEARSRPKAHYRYNRAEIQAELTNFTTQWKNQVEHLTEAVTKSSLLQIDRHVHHRLQTWLRDFSSSNFWIQGPHDVSRPGQNSMTAVSLTALARNHNIPFVAYFCTFTNHDALGTSKRACLEAFMASIVTQLVQLIPERGYSREDLSPARFAALAQGALDVAETLQLVRDVRELGPRLVLVFIDNLQVLEDRSNQAYTRDFLSAIAALCRLNGGNRLPESAAAPDTSELVFGTKICFTTEGYVDGLAQAVELQLLDEVEFDLETTEPISMEVGERLEWDS